MLKNILNLEGAQKLTNNEQKQIKGGKPVVCKPALTDDATGQELCPIGYELIVLGGVKQCCPRV